MAKPHFLGLLWISLLMLVGVLPLSAQTDLFQIAYGDTVSDGVPGPGAGNIEGIGAQDSYTFDATADDEAIFDSVVGNNGVFGWRLVAPSGTVLVDSFNVDRRLALPETGTYTFTVRGFQANTTGVYSFRLLLVPPPQMFAVNIGDTISDGVPAPGAGNLEVPGAVDLYTFDGIAGGGVIFDALVGNTGLARVILTAPDGTELFSGFYLDQQAVFPQSGTYTLRVEGLTMTSTGIYSFQLLNIAAPQIFAISIGDTVSDGVPAAGAGNLEVPGAVDIYTFDGAATQVIIFDALVGNTGQFRVILTAPDGAEVFNQFYQDNQVTLPQTGTYSLRVSGGQTTFFGTYAFQLLDVPPAAQVFAISIGDSVFDGVPEAGAGNLEVPGAVDSYAFDAVAAQEIIFDALMGDTGQFRIILTAPDGTELFDDFYQDQQVTLPQTGTYSLRVTGGQITFFGTYAFQLLNAPPSAQEFTISIGDTVSDGVPAAGAGNLEVPGAVDIYRFDGAAGQNVIFDALIGNTGQFRIILTAPDGTTLFDTFYIDQQVALPRAGIYSLTVHGLLVTDFGVYSFTLVEVTNSSPIATDDTAVTDEDVSVNIGVLSNDTDVDGDTLSIASVTQPVNGAVVNNGTDVTYTPNADFNGTDSFTYTVSDGNGGNDTAAVTVTVNPVNDDPVATDDTAVTDEDVSVFIDVLANDTDIDGDSLSVASVTQPANGLLVNNGTDVTYTPNLNFNGTDSFTYTVSDGNGGSDTTAVTVTVNPINDAPVAVDDETITSEDASVSIEVLVNDSDVDGDSLVVDSIAQPSSGSAVINLDNTVTYTPSLNFNGPDTFTYVASDGNGGTAVAIVNITVNPVNDDPVATDDTATTDEDVPVSISVLSNDTDVDGDTLNVEGVTQPINGSIANNGTDVTYTPNANFNGTDSFTYTASDGNGGMDTATVTVTVNPVNDDPVATDDTAATDEDVSVNITVLSNDTDVDGDSLVVESVNQPANGTVTTNGTDVTYTPNADFNGTDSFTYTVSDGNGGMDTTTVTVTVNPVNDNPVADDDTATTDEDVPVSISVLSNDTDVDGDTLVVESVNQPANGTVTTNGTDVTYTPNPNFNGMDTFTYTVSDVNGGTDTATVVMTINPVNDDPVAGDDNSGTNENAPVTVDVLANDSDVDGDTLTVISVTQPANGMVTNNATDVTYSPNANFSGIDTFTYTVGDGNGGADTATVTVSVNASNSVPLACDDSGTMDEDTSVTIDVLANDIDDDGDALTVQSVTQPANGTVANNGTDVTYTPYANFNGVDTFTYTINDGNGGISTASVTVTVNPVNDAPTVDDAAFDVAETSPIGTPVGTLTASDVDSGTTFTFAITSGNIANAFAIDSSTGAITVSGALDYETIPVYTLVVSVTDNGSPVLADTASVTITVLDADEIPPTADIIDVTPDPRDTAINSITITFSEVVTGFDIGDLTLTRDGAFVPLTGAALNGSGDSYTLDQLDSVTGDPGIYVLTLAATGSGILDVVGNGLTGDASDTWVVTGTAAPAVVSSLRADADPTSAQSVNFTVTFSANVFGVDTTDFTLTMTGGIQGASVSAVSGGASTYTVTVDTGSGDGTLRLDVLNDGSITDASSNALSGGTFTTGEAYTVTKSAPIYTSTPPTLPPPPPAPTCDQENFDEHSGVRTGIPDAIRYAMNCRVLYWNGQTTTWLGSALYGEANLGIPGLHDLGIEQAVDIFSPSGMNYFDGGAVFCLRGTGTLIWLAAKNAPRIAEIIGSYTVDDFPGFTCATLFEPGTLILVRDNPLD